MNIVAIIDNALGAGGGFDQALNAIVQIKKMTTGKHKVDVVTTHRQNIDILRTVGVDADFYKIAIRDLLMIKFSQSTLWRMLQPRLKWVGPLEKYLINKKCDLVYFVTPNPLCYCLQKLNYINTLWDLCHREAPEFPEVREFGEFSTRDKKYHNYFGAAVVTITDSSHLAMMASQFYGVSLERFLTMPFAPSPFLKLSNTTSADLIKSKYNVENYFYYPAQFWAHKNHIRILQALILLREKQGYFPNVVFTGRDYGNVTYVNNFIKDHNLHSQVNILGLVPAEDIRGLYENSIAVVMPTYFGPTNLPPLEAWSLGVPLIYSAHLSEQAGDAALLVDVDSADDIAKAMQLCMLPDVRQRLIKEGYARLTEIEKQRKDAEVALCRLLDKFAVRRQCWD